MAPSSLEGRWYLAQCFCSAVCQCYFECVCAAACRLKTSPVMPCAGVLRVCWLQLECYVAAFTALMLFLFVCCNPACSVVLACAGSLPHLLLTCLSAPCTLGAYSTCGRGSAKPLCMVTMANILCGSFDCSHMRLLTTLVCSFALVAPCAALEIAARWPRCTCMSRTMCRAGKPSIVGIVCLLLVAGASWWHAALCVATQALVCVWLCGWPCPHAVVQLALQAYNGCFRWLVSAPACVLLLSHKAFTIQQQYFCLCVCVICVALFLCACHLLVCWVAVNLVMGHLPRAPCQAVWTAGYCRGKRPTRWLYGCSLPGVRS